MEPIDNMERSVENSISDFIKGLFLDLATLPTLC